MSWLRKVLDWWRLSVPKPWEPVLYERRILERAKPRDALPPGLRGLHDRLQEVRRTLGGNTVVLLLELASDEEDVRLEAYHELTSRIWHQGTIYEVSAHAVPFLVELARSPDVPERWRPVEILGLLATGKGYHQVHDPADARYAKRIRIEERHVAAVLAELRSHAAEFEAWTKDPDPQVSGFARDLLRALEAR